MKISLREAAKTMGITEFRLRNMILYGEIKGEPIKGGSPTALRYEIDEDSVNKWKKEHLTSD